MARLNRFVFLLLLFLSGAAYAANLTAVALSEQMEASEGYSYTLSAGDESVTVKTVSGESFGTVLEGEGGGLKQDKNGGWIADPHLSHRIAPFVLQRAFAGKEGDVALEIKLDGKKHKLYASGTAEAVYALRLLGPQGKFGKWLDAHAPLDPALEDLSKAGDLYNATKEAGTAPGLKEQAKEAYAAKRPAIMRRFNKSYLYYGDASDIGWQSRVSKDGKTMYEVASSADLMYAAQFWFRFTRGSDGKWMQDKIYGEEIFKGE